MDKHKCEVCEAILTDKFTRVAFNNWDWFAGYLDRTVHFCPKCQGSRQYKTLKRVSRVTARVSADEILRGSAVDDLSIIRNLRIAMSPLENEH